MLGPLLPTLLKEQAGPRAVKVLNVCGITLPSTGDTPLPHSPPSDPLVPVGLPGNLMVEALNR